jgi:hypothetical protein
MQVGSGGALVALVGGSALGILGTNHLPRIDQLRNNRTIRHILTYTRTLEFTKLALGGTLISGAVGFLGPSVQGDAFFLVMGYLVVKSGLVLFAPNEEASNQGSESRRPLLHRLHTL